MFFTTYYRLNLNTYLRTMKVLINVISALLFSAVVLSCGREGQRGNGDDNYFSDFHTFSHTEWPYTDSIAFRVDTLRDSTANGPVSLALRHTNGFNWANLWVEVSLRKDSALMADTFNIPLADVEGNWYGKGIGPSRQITFPLYDDVTINRGDTIWVRHIMRVDNLQNIEQIGIIFAGNP